MAQHWGFSGEFTDVFVPDLNMICQQSEVQIQFDSEQEFWEFWHDLSLGTQQSLIDRAIKRQDYEFVAKIKAHYENKN